MIRIVLRPVLSFRKNKINFFLFLFTLFLPLYQSCHAVEKDGYFFYHGLNYGSESIIHPVRLIINGGFGIMQMDNRDNHLKSIDFKNGVDNLWMNLKDPVQAIEQDGWNDFFMTQVVPISVNRKKAYYWPNYTQHLIGGGMSYRLIEEWYRLHHVGHPRMASFITLNVYHFLNEVVETSDFVGYNVDPIADIYIFNPLGMLMFSSDRVCRFFSNTLNMADWSYQPSLDPFSGILENNGQNFVMKYKIKKSYKWSLFYHWGTHAEVGASFERANGDCISFGTGMTAKGLVNISESENVRRLTTDLVLTAGLFYDRNNSLLASLLYSQTQDYRVRINVYPGVVKIYKFSPGFFMSLNHENKPSIGINFRLIPLGLARVF